MCSARHVRSPVHFSVAATPSNLNLKESWSPRLRMLARLSALHLTANTCYWLFFMERCFPTKANSIFNVDVTAVMFSSDTVGIFFLRLCLDFAIASLLPLPPYLRQAQKGLHCQWYRHWATIAIHIHFRRCCHYIRHCQRSPWMQSVKDLLLEWGWCLGWQKTGDGRATRNCCFSPLRRDSGQSGASVCSRRSGVLYAGNYTNLVVGRISVLPIAKILKCCNLADN